MGIQSLRSMEGWKDRRMEVRVEQKYGMALLGFRRKGPGTICLRMREISPENVPSLCIKMYSERCSSLGGMLTSSLAYHRSLPQPCGEKLPFSSGSFYIRAVASKSFYEAQKHIPLGTSGPARLHNIASCYETDVRYGVIISAS